MSAEFFFTTLFGPLFVTVMTMLLGFTTGTIIARRQERDHDAREAELGDFRLSTLSRAQGTRGSLVIGSTVVGFDYFRRVALLLRKFFGGRFRMHENMMRRARREAVLRMAETARAEGASGVCNIRLVSSNLASSSSAMGGCEVMAYGTAVWD